MAEPKWDDRDLSKWDERWFDRAKSYASWSKDPSTKVGAVAIDGKRNIEISAGYNGFPRGILDTTERLNDRPTKYQYIVHAEQNVVYTAARNGVSLEGTTLYVYGLPICSECCKGVIQSGISEVRMMYPKDINPAWIKSGHMTNGMLREAGIDTKIWILQ